MYEEAILTVVTVRDFTQVFDNYAQFEENMIASKMETTAELGQDEDGMCGFIDHNQFKCVQFTKSFSSCICCIFLFFFFR